MKKSWLVVGISIFIVLATLGVGNFYFSPVQRLQRHGYSATESAAIIEKVNPEAIAIILDHDYHPDFVNLIHDDNFDHERINAYLTALEKSQLPATETISLVNHPDFNPDRTYSINMLQIMQSPNYLSSRAERYFNFLDQNVSMACERIVALVNANRDRDFYTEAQPAQTELGEAMLVNKYYFLSEDYAPDLVTMSPAYGTPGISMERTTYGSFQNLYQAALSEGIQLYVTSGYRNYHDQAEVFASWVDQVGETEAPNFAAVPGYSEHQTGYALDVFAPGYTTTNFAGTSAASWLAVHAPEFGFILRYPEDKVDLTGYDYEAWHLRFVGQAAQIITEQNITLEEYYAKMTEQ